MLSSTTTMAMPSMASLFSFYATMTTFFTLLEQSFNRFVPRVIQDYLYETLQRWLKRPTPSSPSLFTLIIRDTFKSEDYYTDDNQVYAACEKYICSKLRDSARCLGVVRSNVEDDLTFSLVERHEFKEVFEGVEFTWKYASDDDKKSSSSDADNNNNQGCQNWYLKLTVKDTGKSKLVDAYLPSVVEWYNKENEKEKELYLHTLATHYDQWHAIKFNHPFTFETLAMDPELKRSIIHDLDRFVKRKEFYKRVGKAWKRGYLLYGPPGTGKSSLIAAMANCLKFDIYDLQLSIGVTDTTLRKLMVQMSNKSILVIEDVDCTSGFPRRRWEDTESSSSDEDEHHSDSNVSLSGLLNFLDGLWSRSSCGDERIIIFTTNHKDKLDPALLRPGRMDMHIHMSYLTMPGFRILASNYLDIGRDNNEHPLFEEIESLIGSVNVSAAEVAETMLRYNEDVDATLQEVIEFLKMKMEMKMKKEGEETKAPKMDDDNALSKNNV